MPSEPMRPEGFDRVFETMPPDARDNVRRHVLASVAPTAAVARTRRLTVRAVAAYLTLSLASTGVAYASSGSLPGQPLYGVKLAMEEASIAAAPTSGLREALMEKAALSRADEVAALAGGGAEERRVSVAVRRFEQAARRALTRRSTVEAGEAEQRLRERVERVPAPAKESVRKALTAAGVKDSGTAGKGKPAPSATRKNASRSKSSSAGSGSAKGHGGSK